MQRIGLILLGMASLVASGVIMDRERVGLDAMAGLGQQGVQGSGRVLTRDELLKQKFILDILQQIYVPLQQQDLLKLDDRNIITNEDLYIRPLTQEMQEVLDLIRSNQMLDKHAICYINNEQHVQQIVGFYRLLVNARDFETFKRLAVYGRQHVNNELFVYSLILAIRERHDTHNLIVPALYEILPQLFIKDHVVDQVRQLDTGVSTLRPQLADVIGMRRRNSYLNSGFANPEQGGLWGILNKSQFWMPWREMHQQLAVRKMLGGTVVQQDQTQSDKVVISLPGNGLLSQDIGLKAYLGMLIDEVLLNQDTIRRSDKYYAGIGGLESDTNENIWFGRQGQYGGDNIMGGIRKNRIDNDLYRNSYYGDNLGDRQFNTEDINRDRLLHPARRFGLNADLDQNIYRSDNSQMLNRRKMVPLRFNADEEIDRNLDSMPQRQNVISTVSINDPRLLFVGRRRQNPNNVVNMSNSRYGMDTNRYQVGNNQYDEDDYISGGRSVSNDKDERKKNKYNRYDEEDISGINNERYTKYNKHDKVQENDKEHVDYRGIYSNKNYQDRNNEQDDLYDNTYRGIYSNKENYQKYQDKNMKHGKMQDIDNEHDDYRGIYSNKNKYQNYQDRNNEQDDLYDNTYRGIYDYNNRYSYARSLAQEGVSTGRNVNDFLNMIAGRRMGQRQQYYDNDRETMYYRDYAGQNNGETYDKYLPTIDINDERLLHINRRKLNENVEGVQVNNMAGRTDNDDYDYYLNNRYNTAYQGYQRNNYNEEQQQQRRSYDDELIDLYAGERTGRRSRRSIVNQNLDQTSTVNGKLLLHSLQQLVARLNIERIALGQPLLVDNTRNNNVERGLISNNLRGVTITGNVGVQTLNKIENILQQIRQVLQERVGQITIPSYNQKVNEIGLILAGQIQDLGLTNILGDILQQTNPQGRKGLVVNMLENEAAQILLAGIVQVVDQKLQQIYLQREEFISTVRGVTIDNVAVDKLQTYVEETNVDLTNLLYNNNVEQTTQGNGKVVIGRIPRLNHKAFKIEIDVTSDRQQQVVVRNLLVPKVDGQNNIIPLAERRQNVIVLDVTTAELQQGHNSLKLNSRDITITRRDTTPLTRIYQLVMQALNGNVMLQEDLITGQSTLLPHHLLLPRGRTTGLPMQLITVITPLTGSSGMLGIQRGAELDTLFLDNLPLNYPLHCDITSLNDVISMPNLMIKDVNIYHEDNTKMPLINMY